GGDQVPVGHVLAAAAQLGWAPGRVVQRLGELGYPVTHWSWPQSPPDRDERTLLSRNLDGRHPWLDPEQLAPVGHVLAAAAQLGWAPGRVVQRLGELGYPVTQRSWPQTPHDRDARPLLSRNLDGRPPWLDPEQPAPVGHVLTAAAQLGSAPGRVAHRLGELGYPVTQRSWPQTPPDRDDLT